MKTRIQFVIAVLCAAALNLQAATLTVTSTDDSGAGTLRAALASAADGDTIDATGVTGTIPLTSGELLVGKNVKIAGPGPAKLAVDGNHASRVFHIALFETVAISGLTIRNGAAGLGGGIFNEYGTLTVSNCTISANSAQGRGGGIENYGPLNVVNSTISGNVGNQGGGIDNIGLGSQPVRINNSTISSNQAGDFGGGIAHYANGSSVYLTIYNCTFSGNIATNGSGDGIWMYGQTGLGSAYMTIGSTILKAGPSRTTLYTQGNAVSIQSYGYNLCSDWGGYYLFSTGDQLNTDPLLGPLQDNGGSTPTHALLPGSPAIDHGFNFSGSVTDQRGVGFVRTFDDPGVSNASGGDGTDIGAFEVPPKAAATVTLGNLVQSYDGTDKSVTATTTPPGLTVNVTYNGSANAPTNVGSYTVIGTINDPSYQGSVTNTLVIVLQLTAPAWAGNGGFQFGFNTTSGVNYTILFSTNLNIWFPVLTFKGSGGPLIVVDPNAPGSLTRFYRVKIGP